jgi:hypothetical protein
VIRWLRCTGSTAHAFRDGRTTSFCGIATLEGRWKRSPRTPHCVSCENKVAFLAKRSSAKPAQPSLQKFNGSTGRTPQAEAKRHVYRTLAQVIDEELQTREGRMFAGLEHEDDTRRVRYALELIKAELTQKA